MKFIIDRFEGDIAIIEISENKFVDMPRVLIPNDANEGDIINICVDKDATQERLSNIKKLEESLWED